MITYTTKRQARGEWNVHKVVNGKMTEEKINDEPMKREDAIKLAKVGPEE